MSLHGSAHARVSKSPTAVPVEPSPVLREHGVAVDPDVLSGKRTIEGGRGLIMTAVVRPFRSCFACAGHTHLPLGRLSVSWQLVFAAVFHLRRLIGLARRLPKGPLSASIVDAAFIYLQAQGFAKRGPRPSGQALREYGRELAIRPILVMRVCAFGMYSSIPSGKIALDDLDASAFLVQLFRDKAPGILARKKKTIGWLLPVHLWRG